MEFLSILELTGVAAASVSGALMAIKKNMDIFGVIMMGTITAVGGGVIRDIIIGNIPPLMFRNPLFVSIAFSVSLILFLLMYFHAIRKNVEENDRRVENILLIFDTIGLSTFTIDGFIIGMSYESSSFFLCSFLGVCTGVGGGVLRDLCCMEIPSIFRKRVYAIAAILGTIVTGLLWNLNDSVACFAGFAVICVIRFCAAIFKWSLPRIN